MYLIRHDEDDNIDEIIRQIMELYGIDEEAARKQAIIDGVLIGCSTGDMRDHEPANADESGRIL